MNDALHILLCCIGLLLFGGGGVFLLLVLGERLAMRILGGTGKQTTGRVDKP